MIDGDRRSLSSDEENDIEDADDATATRNKFDALALSPDNWYYALKCFPESLTKSEELKLLLQILEYFEMII